MEPTQPASGASGVSGRRARPNMILFPADVKGLGRPCHFSTEKQGRTGYQTRRGVSRGSGLLVQERLQES